MSWLFSGNGLDVRVRIPQADIGVDKEITLSNGWTVHLWRRPNAPFLLKIHRLDGNGHVSYYNNDHFNDDYTHVYDAVHYVLVFYYGVYHL